MTAPASFAARFSFLFAAGLLFAQEPTAPARPAADAAADTAPPVATPVEPVLDEATASAIRLEGIEKSQAMRLLRDLTSKVGHRLTGSDNFTKACDWAVAEFQRMGLQNVHKEKWGEWPLVWNRGTWKGRITSPIELDIYVATEAWTASTNGPRTGRVRMAPADAAAAQQLLDKGELAGLWLAYEKRLSTEVRSVCEKAEIAGWVYRAAGDAKYPTRVRVFGNDRVARASLKDVPKVPVVGVQSDHYDKLAELLEGGAEVVCEIQADSEFRAGPIELHNVIAEIPGTTKPDEVVIVCGHLDSWHQVQGCTDNGTGTTSTMEAARILAAVGAKPERTIRFCLWGGEEQGLLGSAQYVKMHRTDMDMVSAVFNHDTGTNWAASLTVADTMYEPMRRVVEPMLKLQAPDEGHIGPTFVLRRSKTISGGGGSDHASFIAAGVPGLNWSLKGRSDYFGYTWHSQWDTIDVAIEEYQRHTSTVIALAALGTANLPALLDRSGVVRGGGRQAGSYAGALFDADMEGFKFTKIEKDGRAAKLGIQVGDVLKKANGQSLDQMFEIFRIARDLGEDAKTMALELERGTEKVTVQLDLEDLRKRMESRGRGERGGNRDGQGEGPGGERGAGGARGGENGGAGSQGRGNERD